MQNPVLKDMFPILISKNSLRSLAGAEVLSAVIIKEKRMLELKICGSAEESAIKELQNVLIDEFDLTEVVIKIEERETSESVSKDYIANLFFEKYPPAKGLLAGAEWELDDSSVKITIVNGGKELLKRVAPEVASIINTMVGREMSICIESRTDSSAFESTEKMRREAIKAVAPIKKNMRSPNKKIEPQVIMGKAVKGEATPMKDLNLDIGNVTVSGEVFAINSRELKKRRAYIVSFDMTDYTGSIRVNKFMEERDAEPVMKAIKKGMALRVYGRINWDRFESDMILEPQNISVGEKTVRLDTANEKRVELHMHTSMSSMDALTRPDEIVELAAKWGHKAIAITDHGVAHAFPDMYSAGKKYGMKIIYGVEGYFTNDMDETPVVRGDLKTSLNSEFIAFDIETTGLSAVNDEITEIGAVLWSEGEIKNTFSTFVNPRKPIPPKITSLTGITNEMLKDAPLLDEALSRFLEFVGDRPLVAHNADFDIGFIREALRKTDREQKLTSVDTLELSRALLPELKKHKLDIIANHLGLPEFNHHRALDDAMTVAHMLTRFFNRLEELGIQSIDKINGMVAQLRDGATTRKHIYHIVLLAKNKVGLRNLYKLISLSHLEHFKRNPIIPKSLLAENREGIIIGSACENSELFSAVVRGSSIGDLKRIAEFYDYLEIQPICNNMFMLRKGLAGNEAQLREFNRTVCMIAAELNKPVCATGDVHFLNPQDEIYRHILLASKKFDDCDEPLPLYFKSTDEMLEEFSYLGEQLCYDVVINYPNKIADMCEEIKPLPDGLFPPTIENSAEELRSLVENKLRELYGENPPQLVRERVDFELESILGRHYDVIYMSAQKLVADSLEHGYLVGSRGSVGSSIVAYLSGITEVNSLPPHYRCPDCKHADFEAGKEYGCGVDMPDELCPVCGAKYVKDGFNIPFETFLGYGGKKVPDIDLNFSGEYQAKAHKYTEELFGKTHVFRAGTIGTVAEKTAYGYAKKYLEERGIIASKAEENRLALGCVGIKRTTGQHPGGMVVIPQDKEIYDFCPVQHPADDTSTDIITTHFEYHSMEDNLLKLDILGHDDPTMIKMLEDLTGVDAKQIPLDDADTMSLFTSTKALGIENDSVLGSTGACAIPEFGTKFVRGMLVDTQPTKFDTLIRISGFSHGTDVWLDNARDLILSGTATVSEAIGCRDDIMLYLISKGVDMEESFNIMEAVRKGKGLKKDPNWEPDMRAHGVPEWYIDSCNKIKYMFPKAHAVAYVIMAFRIAWFKVHRPLAFYAAYFSIRAKAFDAQFMCQGMETVITKMKELQSREISAVEQDMLVTLEVCYEFYKRGFTFHSIDLEKSDAVNFVIEGNGLIPPFVSVAGLGETAARSIAQARQGRRFISVEELSISCPKVSKTHIEQLKAMGAFGEMPDSSQITLF